MMPSRLTQILILSGMTLVVLAVITLAILSVEPAWLPLPEFAPQEQAMITLSTPTPVPTFTMTPSPAATEHLPLP